MLSVKGNENYTAKIIEVGNVFDIVGADRIGYILVDFQKVIVAKTTQPGEIRVFFPPECQISHQILHELNEYRYGALNKNGQDKAGFFEANRRVKAISMRGVKSMGYTIPINEFQNIFGVEGLEKAVGQYFDHVNETLVCNKYVKKVGESRPNKKVNKANKFNRIIDNQFEFHADTANLRRNVNELSLDDEISIYDKKHGSSWIVSNVLTKRKLSLVEKVAKFFGAKVLEQQYDHLASSRRVVRNKYIQDPKANNNGFYDVDIWTYIKESIKDRVPKGYRVYGEIVGYVPNYAKPIQKHYDYGCAPGEFKLYVYRVNIVNSDGVVYELSNKEIKQFCKQWGFEMTEHYYTGSVINFLIKNNIFGPQEKWRESFIAKLEELYNGNIDPLCTEKVPAEGVVIRVQTHPIWKAFKLKDADFLMFESKQNDKGEQNIEDNS